MSRPERQPPQRATFRLPVPALFFPVLLMFCVTPLATSGGAWAVTFAVPVLALVWVVVTRTKATPTGVTAYGLLGAKRMKWTELAGLEFKDARWAIAVALDGRRVRLPMVRPRDLPRLVAVSGGSLTLGFDAPADDAVDDGAADVDDASVGDGAVGDDAIGDGTVGDGTVGEESADDRPTGALHAGPAVEHAAQAAPGASTGPVGQPVS